jgi:predicted phosphoadenosine phosphosulfate sulfurtransferase
MLSIERMRHVYDTFDTVCVQFSGGKDSTAVLYLAKEIHEERWARAGQSHIS